MQRSLLIIDDVLANAEEVRRAALKLDYPEPEVAYYPGRNSRQGVNIEGLTQLCSQLTGEQLAPLPAAGAGRFRITLNGDEDRDGYAGIHVDDCHWSGIMYFSKPEDCQGGTDFFRHIPTGMEHAPYKQEHLQQAGVATYREFVDTISRPHSKDFSKWERIMRVPMKFNRLILFRPWLWHTATPGFGEDLESGRLIHLLFFNSAGALARPQAQQRRAAPIEFTL